MTLIFRICALLLIPCLLLAQDDDEDNTFAVYQKAQAAFSSKDYPAFLRLTERMIELASHHSGAQFQYARALAVTGKTPEALQILQRVAAMGGAPPAGTDEAFAGMKENPEFKTILQKFAANRARQGNSDVAFLVPGKDLIPEGIACDSKESKCYLGSIYRRKILVIDSTGVAKDFTVEKQDGLWGVLGMEVDPLRRHLWVATANGGAIMPMIDPDPQTEGQTAIFQYNLETGKLLKKYPAGSKETPLFFNDVAVAPGGDIFISESNGGDLYRISASSETLEKVGDGGSLNYANGIAVSPDGKSVYVSYMEATVVFDTSGFSMQPIKAADTLQTGGFDGMIFYRNSLVGIQMLTGGLDRIVRLHLTENLRGVLRAEVLQVGHPFFVQPTTGDMLGDEFHYIANSQLRSFDEQGRIFPVEKLQDPVILKIDLLESERGELLAMHETGRRAHMTTDVDLLLADAPDGEFISVSSGKIEKLTREMEREFFKSYFEGAKYSEWNDLEAPIVHVSDDGKSGWVITRLRSTRTQNGKEQSFAYAGIMLYEKRDGRWIRTANVSTFQP